jgi:DNA-binding NarL/FixJ family response regulator
VTVSPRVLIADDQPTVRASVRRVLEADGFEVCGECSDADEAMEVARREHPDVCLIDILMPGNGIRATRRIATELPRTAVVVLTASESHDHLIDSIRAGAAGYLLKTMNRERLPSALRGVLDGEAAIPRTLVARLVREFQTQGRRRVVAGEHGRVDLTAREWQVLELMCDRLGAAEIAERLFVSPVTVRRHTSRILAKLGADDRDHAVAMVEAQL